MGLAEYINILEVIQMRKNKQFIAGFLACLILLSAIFITGYAEGITAIINPFPILFDGQPAQVEAYNINGRTFLALGDIAKYFGATAKLNEVTKQIEVNTNVVTEEVKSMSTATEIEYDYTTKLPVGAEVIEYKGCKSAVKYNENIYLSLADLKSKFGIKSVYLNVKAHTETFMKDESTVIVDLKVTGNSFLTSNGYPYYNVNLFSELIGE